MKKVIAISLIFTIILTALVGQIFYATAADSTSENYGKVIVDTIYEKMSLTEREALADLVDIAYKVEDTASFKDAFTEIYSILSGTNKEKLRIKKITGDTVLVLANYAKTDVKNYQNLKACLTGKISKESFIEKINQHKDNFSYVLSHDVGISYDEFIRDIGTAGPYLELFSYLKLSNTFIFSYIKTGTNQGLYRDDRNLKKIYDSLFRLAQGNLKNYFKEEDFDSKRTVQLQSLLDYFNSDKVSHQDKMSFLAFLSKFGLVDNSFFYGTISRPDNKNTEKDIAIIVKFKFTRYSSIISIPVTIKAGEVFTNFEHITDYNYDGNVLLYYATENTSFKPSGYYYSSGETKEESPKDEDISISVDDINGANLKLIKATYLPNPTAVPSSNNSGGNTNYSTPTQTPAPTVFSSSTQNPLPSPTSTAVLFTPDINPLGVGDVPIETELSSFPGTNEKLVKLKVVGDQATLEKISEALKIKNEILIDGKTETEGQTNVRFTEITIDKSIYTKLISENATKVVISLDNAEFSFAPDAFGSLLDINGTNIDQDSIKMKIQVAKYNPGETDVPAAVKAYYSSISANKNQPIYDFNMTISYVEDGVEKSKTLTSEDLFDHPIVVTIPYELPAGTAAENLTILYLNKNGQVVEIPAFYDQDRKTLSWTLVHLSKYSPMLIKTVIIDVPKSHWALNYIKYVVSNGIVKLDANKNFKPNASIKREEFIDMVVKILKLPTAKSYKNNFKDLDTKSVYYNSVLSALENKIISGISSTKFGPTDTISREDMSVILTKAIKKYKILQGKISDLKFSDKKSISLYASTAVAKIANANIITGKKGNKFDPKGLTTRAEAAVVIYKTIKYILG